MGTVQAQSAPTTGPELAARARALIPMLAENAAQAEKQRKPVDAVISALEEAEIYKLMVPKCYGRLESVQAHYSKRVRSERGAFSLSGQPVSARLA